MPRPAAGVPGKGMSRRRHRTAERQPGAGNSHIGPYVRRDAEASQVTVPAPLLRQGFYERTPASWNECRKAGALAPAAKAFRALRGCEGSDRRLPQSWGPSFFIGMRAFMQAGAQAGRGKQREKAEDTRRAEGRESGCGFSRRPESGRLSGRQAGETGKGPKRGWEPGRIGKIRPAGQMLRPIRQPCARKGEKQPAGRRMRFSLYRFVL